MKHKIHHGLDQATAKKVTERAIETYSARFEKYNPQARWESENRANVSFQARGIKLEGSLEIEGEEVVLDLDVPFLLRPFQGKAVTVIEEEIQKWVAKAKSGELA